MAMLGPAAAGAAGEVARHLSRRGQRRADQLAAVNQAATSFQGAREQLLGAMAREGVSDDRFQALQEQLAALEAGETARVRAIQRGATVRRTIAAAALAGVTAGVIGGGLLAFKEFKSWLHIPVEVTTTQRVDDALLKVDQLTDKRLVAGTGTGSADVSTRIKAGPFTLPGAIVGDQAHVTLPRTEVISLRQGGTQVNRVEIDGHPRVLVLVDPSKVDPEIQGDGDPLPGSGASVGSVNSLLQVLGVDRNEQATTLQTATDLSAHAFEAAVARDLTTDKTLASLVATDVRGEMEEVAGGLPAAARRAVLEAAHSTIYVEYADLSHPGAPVFIPPGQEQSHIKLPEAPQASSITIGRAVLNMTPSTSRLESVGAADSLAAIAAAQGYALLYQPVGIDDAHALSGARS